MISNGKESPHDSRIGTMSFLDIKSQTSSTRPNVQTGVFKMRSGSSPSSMAQTTQGHKKTIKFDAIQELASSLEDVKTTNKKARVQKKNSGEKFMPPVH